VSRPSRMVIPEYDAATVALATEVLKSLAWAGSPILEKMQKVPVTELPRDSAPSDVAHGASSSIGVESVFTESFDAILSGDVDAWVAMLDEQASKATVQIEKQFFEFINRVTDEAGQTVDARGQPLSHDPLNDMLEKIHIDFDQEGKPELPTMVVHPKQFEKLKALGNPTAEQLKRREEIIERKRREFLAGRRVRKLE
jgi:hypothetical protein